MQSQPLNYIEVYTSIPVFYRCYIQVWVVYLTQCPLFHFPLVGSKERSRKAKCNVRELRKKRRMNWKENVKSRLPPFSFSQLNFCKLAFSTTTVFPLLPFFCVCGWVCMKEIRFLFFLAEPVKGGGFHALVTGSLLMGYVFRRFL